MSPFVSFLGGYRCRLHAQNRREMPDIPATGSTGVLPPPGETSLIYCLGLVVPWPWVQVVSPVFLLAFFSHLQPAWEMGDTDR